MVRHQGHDSEKPNILPWVQANWENTLKGELEGGGKKNNLLARCSVLQISQSSKVVSNSSQAGQDLQEKRIT